MRDYTDEIEELLEQASVLDRGSAQVALMEEAVRLADLHNDVETSFKTRLELIEAATFAGQPDLALVTFSWCLSQCDRDPEAFPESQLLWKYKWVIDELPLFAQVSREQIEKMLSDMAERYQRAGSTLHAVGTMRRAVAILLGDKAMAEEGHKQMEQTRRDWLSNCAACVADGTVEHYLFLGQYREALAAARPILKGHQVCAEVPHRTYASLLEPLLRSGQLEEAMDYHVTGYRMIARNPKFISQIAKHLIFLTLTDNLPRAVKMLEKHLPDALKTSGQAWQFDFYLAGLLLLERLQEMGRQQVRLRLPEQIPQGDKGRARTEELAGWFRGQCQDLACRFDARNGNDWFSRRVQELQQLKKLVTPHPLPGAKKAGDPGEPGA